MSTQQDIYTAGSESCPPMLNKENYVPWLSRLIQYAKSRPNGKLIHNSILNGPYVKKMIPEPGDANRDITVTETFHLQTDDELFDKELKQIKADDQAIQTILLGLPEDIYAAVDSCKTAQEIWLRVQQMMKGSDIGIQEKKAKLFNEWEMFTSNEGESIESYYHRFLKLMNDLKRNKHFPSQSGVNVLLLFIRPRICTLLITPNWQFCDSDLEVVYRRDACFVRNLEGVDLLKGARSTNLYTINLHEMASASPICLMARASSTKSWLWHQQLSHLNFDTINDLARNDLVAGLPKFKYHKEHLFPSCEQGKSKRASHPPKPVPNSRQRLHLLHMDLCGPMRNASINGKWDVLVIMDDYSCYTWVHFLRSKDKVPEVIIKFLKRITVLLQSPVIIIRTDNGTEFKNQVLKEYFDNVGISPNVFCLNTAKKWSSETT
nr:retrovirus-related Pol polyprotein from transposon TNT 1-94 [Tanacetum cinerariifolium]